MAKYKKVKASIKDTEAKATEASDALRELSNNEQVRTVCPVAAPS